MVPLDKTCQIQSLGEILHKVTSHQDTICLVLILWTTVVKPQPAAATTRASIPPMQQQFQTHKQVRASSYLRNSYTTLNGAQDSLNSTVEDEASDLGLGTKHQLESVSRDEPVSREDHCVVADHSNARRGKRQQSLQEAAQACLEQSHWTLDAARRPNRGLLSDTPTPLLADAVLEVDSTATPPGKNVNDTFFDNATTPSSFMHPLALPDSQSPRRAHAGFEVYRGTLQRPAIFSEPPEDIDGGSKKRHGLWRMLPSRDKVERSNPNYELLRVQR